MAEKFSHLYSVFVGNLHEDVSENELCQLFMGSGEVVDHVLIKGKERNKSNFGFVRYATQEEAVKSIKDFNGWSFKSQRIIVDIASNSGQKLNFAQTARSDETVKLSLNDPPPSLWSTSSHDSVLNYNRVKEACSWVTDEFFATTHGGICNTEHIINDLDKKEKATLLPIPLMKPTGTTSYRMVIKSLKDRESSLNFPPDQSPSSSVQNQYNIILEELQKYLKPWTSLHESPVCERGGHNSPVGQSGEFNSPVGQSGDHNSTVPQSGDNYSPVGQAEDINNSPVGQSGDDNSTVPPGDNNSPVGQAEDINNSPLGQSGELNSPVCQSGDDNSTVPPGDNNSPVGQAEDINNSSVGQSGEFNSLVGQSGDVNSTVPPGDNNSPVGQAEDINNSPVGQSGEFNSLVGQSGDDNSTVPPGNNNSPLGQAEDMNNSHVGQFGDYNSPAPQSRYINNAPVGQIKDHDSPVNESGDTISAVRLSVDVNESPVTVSYINKSPEGQLPEAKRPMTWPATDSKMPELISHDNSNNIMVLMKQRFLLATHSVSSPRPTGSPHMSGPAQFPAPPLFPPPQPRTSSCQVLWDFRSSMRDRMRPPAHVTKDCKTLRSTAAVNIHFVAEERDQSGWTFDKQERCTNTDQWATMFFDANCFQ